jgi:hypothetical protein
VSPKPRPAPEKPRFRLEWYGASSAVIDLEATTPDPTMAAHTTYTVRYNSPLRPTMRGPSQEMPIGELDLDQMSRKLGRFAQSVGATRAGGAGKGRAVDAEQLVSVGRSFARVLRRNVRAELQGRGLFVEIGTDENLLHIPWELMHDGDDFLCLKHYVGRYVNLRKTLELNSPPPRPPDELGELGELKVLVVSVPAPRSTRGSSLGQLTAARAETKALVKALNRIGVQPATLTEQAATVDAFLEALGESFHIIHFAGHAAFDPGNPRESVLFLDDGELTVGWLTATLSDQQSILCVVNGCETAAGGAAATGGRGAGGISWKDQYNIYGLARAFLETGAYLLGSRWQLTDKSAARFAEAFYGSLLGEGDPIGRAVAQARAAAKDAAEPGDYSWASYMFYGDPRITLSRADKPKKLPSRLGSKPPPKPSRIARRELTRLAAQYGEVRAQYEWGAERTSHMTKVVDEAKELGAQTSFSGVLSSLFEGSDGERIVALGLIQAKPEPQYLEHVLDAIERPRSGFEQYHALQAVSLLLGDLSAAEKSKVAAAVGAQRSNEAVFGTDRYLLAGQILAGAGEVGVSSVTGKTER